MYEFNKRIFFLFFLFLLPQFSSSFSFFFFVFSFHVPIVHLPVYQTTTKQVNSFAKTAQKVLPFQVLLSMTTPTKMIALKNNSRAK